MDRLTKMKRFLNCFKIFLILGGLKLILMSRAASGGGVHPDAAQPKKNY